MRFAKPGFGVTSLLLAALALASVGCGRKGERDVAGTQGAITTAARYHCPMHPEVTSDKPGSCPICGMDLVPIETPAAAEAPLYHCPMHPEVTSDKPGSCPICGMDLVPTDAPGATEGHPAGVEGRATVQLGAERRQALGVRSEPVTRRPLERRIRTVARIAVDERRVHHVHTKYEAYVEHLYVDFIGKHVKAGEPLVALYSPELVATQQEYLLALRANERLRTSALPSVAQGAAELLEAARQRLLLWDVSPEDIERLGGSGAVERTLDLYAETSGFVVAKTAVHGMRVTPQDSLFDIADFSQLWVLADVYESDLPLVRLGMSGDVSVSYLPGRRWRGPVTYIAPTVDERTRTIKVRLEVENRDELLKPEMFADVELRAALGNGLWLPESAVIDTGDRRLVFVDLGEGRFEPREVATGVKVDGGVQLLAGVQEGERVVVSANFLIDSESSLRAALRSLAPAPAHQH